SASCGEVVLLYIGMWRKKRRRPDGCGEGGDDCELKRIGFGVCQLQYYYQSTPF
uniref:Uncharacterized protein n=1 Tax=Oryza brachyantha TaxID=4533 RepID=J3MAL2_ORYBR